MFVYEKLAIQWEKKGSARQCLPLFQASLHPVICVFPYHSFDNAVTVTNASSNVCTATYSKSSLNDGVTFLKSVLYNEIS